MQPVYVIQTTTTSTLNKLGSYLPQFLGGLLILVVGVLLASVLKAVVLRLFRYLNLERWFAKAHMSQALKFGNWPNIIGEIVRWAVIIIFLIPAVEAWGLPQVTAILNQLLLYIPNVIVAVIVGFVGLGVANIAADVTANTTDELGSSAAHLLSTLARYAIIFFTALVVLNQLGVAADLIRILFTGIVAMLAIAGGLAFGLGGQEQAKQLIKDLNQRIEVERPKIMQQKPVERPAQPTVRRRGRR